MKRLLLLFLFIPVLAYAQPPTRVIEYTSGTTIRANDVTTNEDELFGYLQTGIDTIRTDGIDSITEIKDTLKTGSDTTLVTGTSGTNGNCAEWNADGDLIDAGDSCGTISAVGDCSTGDCFTGSSGTTLSSNTDVIIDLDEDNNGTETFQIKDGADATVFEVSEDGSVLVDDGVNQGWLIDQCGNDCLNFEAQDSNTQAHLQVYSGDRDRTDNVGYKTFGFGSKEIANNERGVFQWNASNTEYTIKTASSGTGGAQPISIYTEGNRPQIYLDTSGNVGIGSTTLNSVLEINGDVSYVPQTSTIADTGDANPATSTLTPTSSHVQITCSDTDSCDITMGESNIADGQIVHIVNMSTNEVDFAASTGVLELLSDTSVTLEQYDSVSLTYASDRWVQASGGSASGVTDTGIVVHVTSITDDFAVGGTTASAPIFIDEGSETVEAHGGFIVGDGTDTNASIITVDLATANQFIQWDDTNQEFDFSAPINASGSGPSALAQGLTVNDSGGNTSDDDFIAATAAKALALQVDASANRVYVSNRWSSAYVESPVDADDFILMKAYTKIQISDIHCIIDPQYAGSSVVIDVRECNSTGDSCVTVDSTITCDNDGAEDDGSLSNGTVDINDWILLDIGTVTGTVTGLTVTIAYDEKTG